MAGRRVYTKEEEKMVADWKERGEKQLGWLDETPSAKVAYPVYNRVATKDLIRHMAYAADYKNPLWRDEKYARNTRWGNIIAPPFFLHCVSLGGPYNLLIVPSQAGTLSGMWVSEDWEFFEPIYANDSFKVWVGPYTIEDATQPDELIERRFKTVGELRYINQKNEVVGVLHRTDIIKYLPPGSDIGKIFRLGIEHDLNIERSYYQNFKQTKEYKYTKAEIRTIDRMYDSEQIRSAKIRYWDDVNVGDELEPVVMGPITAWDTAVELQGFGIARLPMMETRRQTPQNIIVDPATNIPHKTIEIHLSGDFAAVTGLYSSTLIQHTIEHFLGRLITNWMGDDGFLRRFRWFKMANTPLGDTIFGRGKVVRKYIDENGDHLVDLDTWMETIRGYVSNACPAIVKLVSKKEPLGMIER
jgi:hypothetical protein